MTVKYLQEVTALLQAWRGGERGANLMALGDALAALAAMDERKADATGLRFFGGLSVEETAEVLSISPDTVMRDWRLAKVRLWCEMKHGAGGNGA